MCLGVRSLRGGEVRERRETKVRAGSLPELQPGVRGRLLVQEVCHPVKKRVASSCT